ncbi:MAG: hypothetical protein IKY78_03490 [Clostridia bacterium]|nr:hypothetical protein [Clostridia bacterium]
MKKFFWIIVIIAILAFIGTISDEKEDDPWTNSDGSSIVCRRVDCGERPVYPDWNRRYCSVHIKESHYCRHPDCSNKIPNDSEGVYCSEHQ